MSTVPLAELLDDVRSGFASGKNINDGVPQVRMNNVTSTGLWDWGKVRRVPKPSKGLNSLLIQKGDVLFNQTNSPELVGKSAYFEGFKEDVTFSNHFLRLRANKNKLDGRYLARWLMYQWGHRFFQGICRQWVNQATVSKDQLLSLCIPLPDLKRQRRIASILDAADALRAKRRAALVKVDSLTQSFFFNMFGDPLHSRCKQEYKSLAEISEFENGDRSSNYPSGNDIKNSGVLFLSTKNIVSDTLDLSESSYITQEKFDSLSRGKARPGDLIITLRGTLGNCCVFNCDQEAAFINAQMMIIRPKAEVLSNYLHSVLSSPSMKAHLQRIGTGVAVQQLTASLLSNVVVPIPAMSKQAKYVERYNKAILQKKAYIKAFEATNQLFLVLQHRAFRGEL